MLQSVLGTLHARFVLTILVISTKDVIPPPERGREVVGEGHMVEVVVVSTRPEGENVLQGPRKI